MSPLTLFFLLLISSVTGTSYESPRYWLHLQFTSADMRLADEREFRTRDDREMTQDFGFDEIPKMYQLNVSDEADHAVRTLFPSWEKKSIRFDIAGREYGLTYNVQCRFGSYGKDCSKMCVEDKSRHYSCSAEGDKVCHSGWTGESCDQEITACSSNPCQNRGQCQLTTPGQFLCSCGSGYEGFLCQTRRTQTVSNTLVSVILVVTCLSTTVLLILIALFYRRAKQPAEFQKPIYVLEERQVKRIESVEMIV